MKKSILNQKKRKLWEALGKAAATALLLVMASSCVMKASATEIAAENREDAAAGAAAETAGTAADAGTSENQTITYVYHQHIGSMAAGGGCYVPIYHVHTGNETEHGGCYGTPVYHAHTGDAAAGNGCYGTPIFHVHTGSALTGGGCYRPVIHKHTDSCYQEVSSGELGCTVLSSEDAGRGDGSLCFHMSCGLDVYGFDSAHVHSVAFCGKDSTIEGFAAGCGKTEDTIEGYGLSCGETEGDTIDAYALNCGKTPLSVEGYQLGCSQDETTPLGKIIVTEAKGEQEDKSALTVRYEDMSGGSVQLAEPPFTWYAPDGAALGTGENISVSENGDYRVVMAVANEDINKESLKAQIGVDDITKPENNGGNDDGDKDKDKDDDGKGDNGKDGKDDEDDKGGGGNGDKDDNSGGDNNDNDNDNGDGDNGEGNNDNDNDKDNGDGNGKDDKKDSDHNGNGNGNGNDGENGSGNEYDDGGRADSWRRPASAQSPTPEILPEEPLEEPALKAQTEQVEPSERKSQNTEEGIEVKKQKKNSFAARFFDSPAVKLITVTVSMLLVIAMLLFLLFFLRMSVKVYNDDGENHFGYIGRCWVKWSDEGYFIEITDKMAERAVTNRYCIKPGFFRYFRGEDEELLVYRRMCRISVPLGKEMLAVF